MKPLSDFLTSNTLRPFTDKTKIIEKLNATWSIVMQEWAEHCKVSNIWNEQLTLQVKNSAWATRIRYAMPEILKIITTYDEFRSVKKIRCKVMTKYKGDEDQPRIQRTSAVAFQLLNDAAENTEHPKLKAALSKLAACFKERVGD